MSIAHTARSRQDRPSRVVGVLALAGMSAAFMQTLLIPIQGELPRLLDATREDTAWVITITLLVSAVFTPISGRLGDMFGKRRVALVLMGMLVLGSLVAVVSATVVPLIIGRGLQGLGMGVIPLGISIVRDVVPADRLGSSVALVSATLGVGAALGLPVSAFVTEHFDWHVLFWLAAGLGLIVLGLIAWLVPESRARTGGRIDVIGVLGLAMGLTGVLLAISRGNEWGWFSLPTLGLFLGGTFVLLVWGWLERRIPAPLVDLRVNARGPVLMTNLASVTMGFALFTSQIAFPQLLVIPLDAGGTGASLLQASLVLMPSGLVMLAMSPVAGRVEHRWGAQPLLVVGSLVIALGYAVATLASFQIWSIFLVNLLIGVGIGLGFAAMPTLIMRSVPASATGAANGFNTLMRSLGTATASAVIAAVLAGSIAGSAEENAGALYPTTGAFQLSFLLGLIAALACAVLSALIPRQKDPPRDVKSLPEPA